MSHRIASPHCTASHELGIFGPVPNRSGWAEQDVRTSGVHAATVDGGWLPLSAGPADAEVARVLAERFASATVVSAGGNRIATLEFGPGVGRREGYAAARRFIAEELDPDAAPYAVELNLASACTHCTATDACGSCTP